ncbi:MAG: DUF4115 domain-containing protein [Oceanospirillaceae bacterium]|nr:DUF4115 domain-containing protein [Oceanospirillaceae bacterium]
MLQFNKIIIIAVLLITTSACVEKSKLATNKQASTEKFQLNILEMEFTGDCWILVKNLDENTNVITGVQAADSKIQLKLPNKHNYKILIGYPSRVNIALNDQVIQLQTRSEQPIALYLNQGTDRFLSQ